MLGRAKANSERGDTIIEVMIVLAVLGLAIGISYATANRSLLNARQAQENTQATELVQSQAESLRSLVSNTSGPDDIYRAAAFCIDTAGHVSTTACQLGEASRYKVTINWGGAPDDKFTIQASWPNALGQGTDTVTLVYRLHPPS